MMRIAITGANSSVGKNLLTHIAAREDLQAMAGVRSESVMATLPGCERIDPQVISYEEVDTLTRAFSNCQVVVHLAGILIESRDSKYQSANVDATVAVAEAARQAGVEHLIFISVVGADSSSGNPYFRTKGQAEQAIANVGIPATVIRTPILLGPGTAGAKSMLWAASQPKAKLLGGGDYTMHPLDVDDLSEAILNSCHATHKGSKTFELVGPEGIAYRDLIRKIASRKSNENISIGKIPIWSAKLGAAIGSRLKGGGITPAVIDVITIDETVTHNAAKDLGITLTSLDQTLDKILEQQ